MPRARRPVALMALVLLGTAHVLLGTAPATVAQDAAAPAASPTPSPAPSSGQAPAPSETSVEPPALDVTWFADPTWTRLRVARGPAAREDATWTVESSSRGAWLFGGRDGQTAFDDLWRFDLAGDRWERLRPGGRGPAPRFGHSAAWIEGTGLVIFGGQRGADFFDDLWAYDPDRGRWSELPRAGQAPAARYGTCAIVDRQGRFVISHGFTFNGRFDDTRAYDFERERWVSAGPDGRRPGERCLHDCFIDAGGDLVLYGGQDNSDRALEDLWTLREETGWKRHDDPPAGDRRLYAVVVAGPDAWIFGGADRDERVLGDLWRVDRETLAFARVRTPGKEPAARSAPVMVADPNRRRLLLFGGEARDAFDDLWQLGDAAPAP